MTTTRVVSYDLVTTKRVVSYDLLATTRVVSYDLVMTHLSSVKELTEDSDDSIAAADTYDYSQHVLPP